MMIKFCCSLILAVLTATAIAQNTPPDSLLQQGIALHDKNDYVGAIQKYDAAIAQDEKFYMAYNEKCLSLFMSGKYDECVDLSKKTLKKFPDEKANKSIYVSYGSALDALGKADDAIGIYKEGIKKCPDYYLLPFNKGITEYNQKKYDDATEDLEKAVTLNPLHASSHQFLAYCVYSKNKMAAAMALSTFLILEPSGKRATKNLNILLDILHAHVEKKDSGHINIILSSSLLDTKSKKEDDFGMTEMMMSMTRAVDMTTDSLALVKKLQASLELLSTATPNKKGFFTKYYVPFLAGLKANDLLQPAAYLIYYTANDAIGMEWLKIHQDKTDALLQWTEQHLGK